MKPGTRVLVCESNDGNPVGASGTVIRKNLVWKHLYYVEMDTPHPDMRYNNMPTCLVVNDDQLLRLP